MTALGNDRWAADLPLERVGRYLFDIEAWRDEFAIYRIELQKKYEAGVSGHARAEGGGGHSRRALGRAEERTAARLKKVVERLKAADDPGRLAILLAEETAEIYAAADTRAFRIRLAYADCDRLGTQNAEFASWYELFPRSQSGDPHRHGTFDDVVRRLPAIREMGFDVVYFPPIHPIGKTNRKGRNNTLKAGPDDPGSPYAIGSAEGGHDAIHPALGTFEDFQVLLSEARKLDLEIALDFAIQASPDHPWLKQHPEWFSWRPDGTIRYAENPPKKYEDIVNFDFYAEGAKPALWIALRDTILFWIDKGVLLFRVDNPHTKPFPFWDWVIDDIRREHPDVVFLAEAFTRPKVMYRLAKARLLSKLHLFHLAQHEVGADRVLTELTSEPLAGFLPAAFFRQHARHQSGLSAERAAFRLSDPRRLGRDAVRSMGGLQRLRTLRGQAGRAEERISQQRKIRDPRLGLGSPRQYHWRNHCAQSHSAREPRAAFSSRPIVSKRLERERRCSSRRRRTDRQNVVLVAISLDPAHAQEADIEIPLWKFGLSDHDTLRAEDLMREREIVWSGKHQRIRLDPELPFAIWRIA